MKRQYLTLEPIQRNREDVAIGSTLMLDDEDAGTQQLLASQSIVEQQAVKGAHEKAPRGE